MSNMKLNNAVEEALGMGDGLGHTGTDSCVGGCTNATTFARSGTVGGESRLSALRINHAEDEQYGMRHHES